MEKLLAVYRLLKKKLLPACIRDNAQPIIRGGLESLGVGTSRITEDCIFID